MDKDLIKMRDLFKSAANIIDEMLELQNKEVSGDDVTKEAEALIGRLVIKMMELQELGDRM